MTDYVTRIELHGAAPSDYLALDQAMAGANFATVTRGPTGIEYKLPTATYFSQAAGLSSADVRNLALSVARRSGFRYDIVTSSGDLAFFLHPTS